MIDAFPPLSAVIDTTTPWGVFIVKLSAVKPKPLWSTSARDRLLAWWLVEILEARRAVRPVVSVYAASAFDMATVVA